MSEGPVSPLATNDTTFEIEPQDNNVDSLKLLLHEVNVKSN